MNVLVIHGQQNKTIKVKDGKVKIIKGASLFNSPREKVIPAANITGVEVKKPGSWINGFIQIQTAGQISANSEGTYTGGTRDAIFDENSVVFAGEDNYRIALEMQKHILDCLSSTRNGTGSGISAADEILKFKKLMEDGVITSEEFEKKKRQLLDL